MTNISIHRVTNLTDLDVQVEHTDRPYIVVGFNIVSHSHRGEQQLGVTLFLKSADDAGQMADAFSALASHIRKAKCKAD